MLGILVINKPLNITSHDVVAKVRKALGLRRVGHAGTLDPLATGVLVVAVGHATRFLQYLPLEPKEYVGKIQFGKETTTQDAEGEVIAEKTVPDDLLQRLLDILPTFAGEIEQIPPMYSAVKKDGKPLYSYAREGQVVERKSRQIFIDEIELGEIVNGEAWVRVVCSGGTYMRTLAHDLGQLVGCGAYLSKLQRTQVGNFKQDHAIEIDQISPERLIPLAEALRPMPMVKMNLGQHERVLNGQFIKASVPEGETHVGLLGVDGNVVSVATIKGNELHPLCVIPADSAN